MENSIKNFLISYLIPSISKVSRVLLIWNFILVWKSEFMLKYLLNFQSSLTLFSSLRKSRRNSKGEWSVEKAANALTDSCSRIETKKYLSLLWINPEIRCCRKIKRFILGFWILHMSHKLNNFFFILKQFCYWFLFQTWISPQRLIPRLLQNIILKSPPRTVFLLWMSFTLSIILTRSERVSSWYSIAVIYID